AGPAEAAVQAAPGVTAMSGFAQAMVHLKGASKSLSGIDPVQGPQVFRITMTKGTLAPLAQGKLLVDQTTSTYDHVREGDKLAMSIIIAMGGVINALALSVLERTREIGHVRSVGMHRRQVRRMIRGEAVVVSVLGEIPGLALGVVLGAALVSTIGTGAGITQI